VIAVVVGLALIIAGVVAAQAALKAQPTQSPGVLDRGIVDVTTQLGLQNASAAGTGVIIAADGLVLTNNHVIRGATSVSVTVVTTGATYSATVVGYDIAADVAVLQMQQASDLTLAPLGNSSNVSIGDAVQAVGNVGGVGGVPTVADGSVVGLDQTITAVDESTEASEQLSGMIATNASVRPGDSGGPLFDGGQVVGIDTAGSSSFTIQAPTAGYAIPIDTALGVARQIEAGASSAQIHIGATAFLGVEVKANSATSGAYVSSVLPGTPAASAGLASGDTIVSLDGNSVSSPNDLADLLIPEHPGDHVTLGWTDSSGAPHQASVALASGPSS
jgi:S1-C subfamily serine protease